MTSPAAPALVDGVDVDRVAAAVAACPAVARLTVSRGGAGSYLPGRRVAGVVVRPVPGGGPARVAVHVVARAGVPVGEVADQVRTAVASLAPGSVVDVAIEDVAIDDTAIDDTAIDDVDDSPADDL